MTYARTRSTLLAAAALAASLAYATPAAAQANRTWVSGTGDDMFVCARTAPCKTFAGALAKTAPGGEINCIDAGAYGQVTINKSVSIVCQYSEAGALAIFATNDITIAAGANDVVFLNGLDLQGVGTGNIGVRFVSGKALHIRNSIIRNFQNSGGLGVSFAPTGAAELYITDTVISENGNAATGGGIEIKPAAGGSAQVTLRRVNVHNNFNNGIRVDSTNGVVAIVIQDSESVGNAQGIALQGGASALGMMVNNSTIASNSAVGIIANGATATIRIDNSNITGNAQGVNAVGGSSILSYGRNHLDGNPTSGAANNGTFTGAIILTK